MTDRALNGELSGIKQELAKINTKLEELIKILKESK